MALPWQISDEEKERQMPYLPPSLQAAPGAIAALDSRLVDVEGTLAAATNQASPDTLVLRDANGEATFSALQISTTATATGAPGKLIWNDADGTLEFQLKGGNVTLQIGQEQVIHVKNDSGVDYVGGEAVYISGANGVNLLTGLAAATSETQSASTIGVVTEPIASNGHGFVTTFGLVRDIDTNHLVEGSPVWLSTVAGHTTATRPTAPNHGVMLGFCLRKSATVGTLFVRVDNGWELDELHNVLITSVAANQILKRNAGNTVWENATLAQGDVGLGNVDNVQQLPMSYLDTDSALTANSDTKVPS